MSLTKKTKDKKRNFEFNKEYIRVVTSKIANNDNNLLPIRLMKCTADTVDIISTLAKEIEKV